MPGRPLNTEAISGPLPDSGPDATLPTYSRTDGDDLKAGLVTSPLVRPGVSRHTDPQSVSPRTPDRRKESNRPGLPADPPPTTVEGHWGTWPGWEPRTRHKYGTAEASRRTKKVDGTKRGVSRKTDLTGHGTSRGWEGTTEPRTRWRQPSEGNCEDEVGPSRPEGVVPGRKEEQVVPSLGGIRSRNWTL